METGPTHSFFDFTEASCPACFIQKGEPPQLRDRRPALLYQRIFPDRLQVTEHGDLGPRSDWPLWRSTERQPRDVQAFQANLRIIQFAPTDGGG